MKKLFTLTLTSVLATSMLFNNSIKAEAVAKTSSVSLLTEAVDNIESFVKADINNDMIIDIKDLSFAAKSYNKQDRVCDVNGDMVVNIYDLVLVSKKLNSTYKELSHIQSAGTVNIRKGPGTDQPILLESGLSNGVSVTIVGKADGWYNVEYNNNSSIINGYVAAQFVKPDIALKGFDCYSRPSLSQYQQFKASGYDFVARYYSSVDPAKVLTKEEAQDASNSGLQLVVVYQDRNNTAEDFNYEKGVAQAGNAIKQAIQVGQPASSVDKPSAIYFAVDESIPGSVPLENVNAYFKGIMDAMNEFQASDTEKRRWDIGVYGAYNIVKYVRENISSNIFAWQTSLGTGNPNYYWKYFSYNIYQNLHDVYDGSTGIKIDINYSNDDKSMGSFIVSPQAAPAVLEAP